eukprot:CAMPEP_0206134874 /NCGR_PEP_ID=MMETSP1473-20131121/279_1 /ASSEMBLY_ACC=CAM_ASM_001109 /TAXON_ID=1461547 /ORGANISM="Stichococcus sp, Strain RCC1054" /LENGTH=179 /DNA_ID=CAMNT_0053526507 /DNA_START=278 /DNA_END=819 /DNA_ORIENTATION=+
MCMMPSCFSLASAHPALELSNIPAADLAAAGLKGQAQAQVSSNRCWCSLTYPPATKHCPIGAGGRGILQDGLRGGRALKSAVRLVGWARRPGGTGTAVPSKPSDIAPVYLNSFLEPDVALLSRLASAEALLAAARAGLALALFSFALTFFAAAFSPEVIFAGGAGILATVEILCKDLGQ